MRVTLVIYSLSSGGSERVMARLANQWASRGVMITIVTLESSDEDFYALDPRVDRVAMGWTPERRNPFASIYAYLRWILWLRRRLRDTRPDVVISFIDKVNLLTLTATLGSVVPVVVSERVDPVMQPLGPLDRLRRLLYRKARALVVQTENVKTWARGFLNEGRITVIPNPIERIPSAVGNHPLLDGPTVVGVGRLSHQKGFDLLLRAFHECRGNHPDWSLVVFGEGPSRRNLEQQVRDLGLTGCVEFPGLFRNLLEFLPQADLFVLSSRWEGFPNALLEAMAGGVAVVSFDCRSGPRDMIRDGESGVLVPPEDVGALAADMDRLMSDEAERKRLGDAAREVVDRFGLESVMSKWDELLEEVLEDASR